MYMVYTCISFVLSEHDMQIIIQSHACLHIFCRFVVLIIDEMKVREDLVYDKTGESLHGFVNLGDVNDQLQQLEKLADTGKPYECFATQMLTLMVRGVFMKLEFPYASFPTQGTVYMYMYRMCLMFMPMYTCISIVPYMYTCASKV